MKAAGNVQPATMTHNRRRRQVNSGENSVGNVVEYQTAFCKSIWYKKQIDVCGTQEAGLHCSSNRYQKPLQLMANKKELTSTDLHQGLIISPVCHRLERWQHGCNGESTQQNIQHLWLIGLKLDEPQSTQSWLLSNDLVSSFSESPPFSMSPLCLIVEWL